MVTLPLVSWWLEDPEFNSGLVHYLSCLCVLQLLDRIATCYTINHGLFVWLRGSVLLGQGHKYLWRKMATSLLSDMSLPSSRWQVTYNSWTNARNTWTRTPSSIQMQSWWPTIYSCIFVTGLTLRKVSCSRYMVLYPSFTLFIFHYLAFVSHDSFLYLSAVVACDNSSSSHHYVYSASGTSVVPHSLWKYSKCFECSRVPEHSLGGVQSQNSIVH